MSNYRVESPSSVRPAVLATTREEASERASDRLDALFRILSRNLSDVFDTFAITAVCLRLSLVMHRAVPRRAAPWSIENCIVINAS